MNSYDIAALVISGYIVLMWRLYVVTQEYKDFRRSIIDLLYDIATDKTEVSLNDEGIRVSRRKPVKKVQGM